jgi:hypothetical protein
MAPPQFITPSTEAISFKRYQTSFYYETMEFIKEELTDVVDNDFFQHIVDKKKLDSPKMVFDKGHGITKLNEIRYDVLKTGKPEEINLEKHIFKDQILKNLFKYSISNLLKTQQNTLFILPCYEQEEDNGASRFVKYVESVGISSIYSDIFTNKSYTTNKTVNKSTVAGLKQAVIDATTKLDAAKAASPGKTYAAEEAILKTATNNLNNSNLNSNQIAFIKPFISDANENIDTFKERIRDNIIAIKETIQNRGNNVGNEPFTQIIYFVNNDNTLFTHYFKTELKKKQSEELNKQFNDFYSSIQKIGQQTINKSSTLKSELSDISVTSINNKINNLSKDIKGKLKNSDGNTIDIKDTAFKQNEQLLLDKLGNFYKIRLDVSAMKSLSSTDNSTLFNIYMRVDNLDRPVVTNEIRPNKDTLYKVYSSTFEPRIGYFSLSNKSKNQYTFTIDKIENSLYKGKDARTPEYLADIAKLTPTTNKELAEELAEIEGEEEIITNSPENTPVEKTPRKNRIFEIRYNFGKTQYKDITKQLNVTWDNNNYIDYFKERSVFENYKWFSHKMIDNKYKENINIKYYKDTVYDIPSLKAYLISEKKYTDKTRLAIEFLDINLNDQELLKYNNFIYENFKKNINKSTVNDSKSIVIFEDRIKRGICSILFELNTLILIKSTVIQTEKEKEKATSDNFKMVKYIYTPVNGADKPNRIAEIEKYFNYTKEEREFLRCDNKPCANSALPSELLSQLSNPKKTFALNLIKITKDVLSDPVKLYLAAECKSRKKKIQEGYYKVMKMFSGGSNRKTKPNRKTKKTHRKPKFRRTYSLKYPKA